MESLIQLSHVLNTPRVDLRTLTPKHASQLPTSLQFPSCDDPSGFPWCSQCLLFPCQPTEPSLIRATPPRCHQLLPSSTVQPPSPTPAKLLRREVGLQQGGGGVWICLAVTDTGGTTQLQPLEMCRDSGFVHYSSAQYHIALSKITKVGPEKVSRVWNTLKWSDILGLVTLWPYES